MDEELINGRKSLFERLLQWREQHLSPHQFLLLLSFLVGLGAAVAGLILKYLIKQIEEILTEKLDVTQGNWQYLVYPVIGIYITSLFIHYIVRDNIGHGITRILYAISRNKSRIRAHNMWTSVVASAITIGFGGSVGAEAPIVLTGSAIGSNLGQRFRLDHRTMMLLVGCGAAGAVAGIFKAPIAGLVFVLEVLMIDLTMASLLPLLVSCVTATAVTYIFSGMEATFYFRLENAFVVERIPSSILLGIVCGLTSLYFTRVMMWFEGVFGKIKGRYKKFALGGTVLSVLIFLFPPLYGEGYETIELLLNGEDMSQWGEVMNHSLFYGHSNLFLVYLLFVILMKVFASTATCGGGGCGGTFAPSLFLGCVTGFVFARVWNETGALGVTIPETNYSLLGMCGLMSGVMHAPLTGIFLVAELTGGYDLFMPLMIVSAFSYLTIYPFEPYSIYTMRLAKKGQLVTHHKDQAILTLMNLDSVIDKKVGRVDPEMDLGKIIGIIANNRTYVFPVVNGDGTQVGIILLDDLRRVMFRQELYHEIKAKDLMKPVPATVTTADNMEVVMKRFDDTKARYLSVLDENSKFIGIVSKNKLYAAYRQTMVDMSEE
jgi:CIC family chloride channel protein